MGQRAKFVRAFTFRSVWGDRVDVLNPAGEHVYTTIERGEERRLATLLKHMRAGYDQEASPGNAAPGCETAAPAVGP